MAKKNRKTKVDVKAAAANGNTNQEVVVTSNLATAAPAMVEDKPAPKPKATPKPKAPATPQAKATATGAQYHVLAGRPQKQQVVYVFGSVGYSLSWVNRAVKLGISPEKLCQEFLKGEECGSGAWTRTKILGSKGPCATNCTTPEQ